MSVPKFDGFSPQHSYFIGLDSDGCVFDTMEVKHKQCFFPAFVQHFEMDDAAVQAQETWEFVNLYSKTRGVNRFKAAVNTVDMLASRPELKGIPMPSVEGLRDWTRREPRLGEVALREECRRQPHPDLERALAWSEDVTEAIHRIVREIPPFPGVMDVLESAGSWADMMVVSQAPTEDLQREWVEHGIAHHVQCIAGQELGSKGELLSRATLNRYPSHHILMVGDSPGDLVAAQNANALFFPIVPGREEESWKRLNQEGLERFLNDRFAGRYQDLLLQEYDDALPEFAPWQVVLR
ncbi:MAG: HAD family hydrolase [Spirochaetales bacterium]|nr:HAD family hydrolase [Spirochaetales bacterium]